jgi:hypothetical protein
MLNINTNLFHNNNPNINLNDDNSVFFHNSLNELNNFSNSFFINNENNVPESGREKIYDCINNLNTSKSAQYLLFL